MKILKSVLKLWLWLTALWYFLYYGTYIENGKLTIGVFACLMFGDMLYYLINFMNFMKQKLWSMAASAAGLIVLIGFYFIQILKVLSKSVPITPPIAVPFDLNIHLVAPTLTAVWTTITLVVTGACMLIDKFRR